MSNKSTAVILCLLGVAGLYWFAQAGDLEPPGTPAPTMATLQEISDKLDGLTVVTGAPVAATGQTECWDAAGEPIDCAGTGQDGEYQAGVAVLPRFTDNGDGTVTDNLTQLIWLENASCFGNRSWIEALSDANSLADGSCGLIDGSGPGDWRLPNIREMLSLFDYSKTYQVGQALPAGHPFLGVTGSALWTSTNRPNDAYEVDPDSLSNFPSAKTNPRNVWPVRGGL